MHRNNHTPQSNECLICFKSVYRHTYLLSMFASPNLCLDCLGKLDVIFKKETLYNTPILYLYTYNDFFKSLLFRYKGQYDLALAPVFLDAYLWWLQRKYRRYIVAPCPSSNSQNMIRGFAPMEEIAKTLNLPLFTGLYKKYEYKQSDQHFYNRARIKDVIAIRDEEKIKGKKVLLIDDVMTSGHTVKACIDC